MRKTVLLLAVLTLILTSCGPVQSQPVTPTAGKKAASTITPLVRPTLLRSPTAALSPSQPAPLASPTTTPTGAAGLASPTASPTLLPPAPLASPTAPAPVWKESPLIDSPFRDVFANPSQAVQQKEIYGSGVALDTDTRWMIDVQVENLAENGSDARTGIVLLGYTAIGPLQSLLLVYQTGQWSIGYQPDSTDSTFSYWETLPNLKTPAQHFVLAISADGRVLSLTNGRGFKFIHAMQAKLFEDAQIVSAGAQIGPQTKITLSKLVIGQLQEDPVVDPPGLPSDSLTPTAAPPVSGAPEYTFYVSVYGSDANPGTANQPFATIEHARDVIRTISPTMHRPIVVTIHGGTYPVSQPIQFTTLDSGQNGQDIIYRAAQGETPIFSGGVDVTGWEKVPGSRLWKTVLENVGIFRQVYVNGVRAQRAALPRPVTGVRWVSGGFSAYDGIVISSSNLPAIAHPQDLELHWIDNWKDIRLPAQDIERNADGTTTIWMKQPHFSYALWRGIGNNSSQIVFPKYDFPFTIENAFEFLDKPGEWYYNPDSQELFYLPLPGENMPSAQVVIPQTQTLLQIAGGLVGQEVHNLIFDGLTFAYAGWTRASEKGTFGWQAQKLVSQFGGSGIYSQEMTPAHVQIDSARDIRFERCRFEHLGAVGLGLINNVSDVTIQGNLFHDISDGAVVVGHWDHAYITAPVVQAVSHNNLIANNLIQDIGVEYWGAPAITAYYVNNLHIIHNEISDTPYTGISVGWGWAVTKDSTTSHDNVIASNLITDILQRARDGGGIYTLGQQPGTIVDANVIRRIQGDYACLYPDEGSAFMTLVNNVCDTAPAWLLLWKNNIHDISVLNSFTNVDSLKNNGVKIQIKNVTDITGQAWTSEAKAIIDQAGLEPAYSYLQDWLNP